MIPPLPPRTAPDWKIQGRLNELAQQYPTAPTEELVNFAKDADGYNAVDDPVYNMFYGYRKEPQQSVPLAQLMQPPQQVQQVQQQQVQQQQQTGMTPEQSKDYGMAGGSIQDFLTEFSKVAPEKQEEIKKGLGISELEEEVFRLPKKSTQQLYDEVYASTSLGNVEIRLKELDAQISKMQQELTDKVNEVNENPWLSESSRVGRLRRMREHAEGTIGNILDSRNQLAAERDRGLDAVNDVVTRLTEDFGRDKEINAAKLEYLHGEAERRIGLMSEEQREAGFENLDEFARGLQARTGEKVFGSDKAGRGYIDEDGDFVELMPPVAKEEKEDRIIGSADTGYFRYNPTTRKLERLKEDFADVELSRSTGGLKVEIINDDEISITAPEEYSAECGRGVNDFFGKASWMKNSFADKLAEADENITEPTANMAFVIPLSDEKYKEFGHCGIVLKNNGDGTVNTWEMNWNKDKKQSFETRNISDILNGGRFATDPNIKLSATEKGEIAKEAFKTFANSDRKEINFDTLLSALREIDVTDEQIGAFLKKEKIKEYVERFEFDPITGKYDYDMPYVPFT